MKGAYILFLLGTVQFWYTPSNKYHYANDIEIKKNPKVGMQKYF